MMRQYATAFPARMATLACAAHMAIGSVMAGETMKLKDIREPVVVGRPPCDAFCGLVRLETGELRHYLARDPATNSHVYLSSKDNGLTWRSVPHTANPQHWAVVRSPVSGEYVRLAPHRDSVHCVRSQGGFEGKWTSVQAWPERLIMLKPPVFVRGGRRILVGCHSEKRIGCGTLYSDDDGLTWKLSSFTQAPPHESGGLHHGRRWNHGAVEPTVVELRDGRIWMLMRTAQDFHYESFSEDGGETWVAAVPSRFYGTITMPTINRLQDGRLLFLWNNTTPLPEMGNPNGKWEDVFTNRDAVHAAISEDDGKTWVGFRELILNEDRNRGDFATRTRSDMSVHQTQIAELPEGRILVSLGQGISRRLLVFDPAWLYETERTTDFSDGRGSITTHQYLKGIKGHCAYNRIAGAELVEDRELRRKVLHVCNPADDGLVIPNQGMVWNFPAATAGELAIQIRFPLGSAGGRVSLLDRWVNATDRWSGHYAMYSLILDRTLAIGDTDKCEPDAWHDLRFRWDHAETACRVLLDGRELAVRLPLEHPTKNGISYLHLISGDTADPHGFLVGKVSFAATATPGATQPK